MSGIYTNRDEFSNSTPEADPASSSFAIVIIYRVINNAFFVISDLVSVLLRRKRNMHIIYWFDLRWSVVTSG